jgi:hypothetical protein
MNVALVTMAVTVLAAILIRAATIGERVNALEIATGHRQRALAERDHEAGRVSEIAAWNDVQTTDAGSCRPYQRPYPVI